MSDSPWMVRYCANDGCHVRIRELVGNQGAKTCKWCQEMARGEREPINVKAMLKRVK